MDSETIVESSFEYTDGKMYRTIKVTMPPCDTNDDAAWAERNDLAERIRALLQAPAPQSPVQELAVHIKCETTDENVIGTTSLNVVRIEHNDDAALLEVSTASL